MSYQPYQPHARAASLALLLLSAAAAALSPAPALAQLTLFTSPVGGRATAALVSADASTVVATIVNPGTSFSARAVVWSASGSLRNQFTGPASSPFLFPVALSANGSALLANVAFPSTPTLFSVATGAASPIPSCPPGSNASALSADGTLAALTLPFPAQAGARVDAIAGFTSPSTLLIPGSRDAIALSATGSTVLGQLTDFAGYTFATSAGTIPLCSLAFGGSCPGPNSPTGPSSLVPVAISADASTIVGGAPYANGSGAAFRLTASGYQELISCTQLGIGSATATAANADGSAIVGSDTCLTNGPWLWRQGTGLRSIRELATALAIDPAIEFVSANAISDDGSTIAGTLYLPDGSDLTAYTLRIPTCDSIDFNNDSLFPSDQDLIDFLSVLAGGPCSTNHCNSIDFNNDSLFPSDEDLLSFLRTLAGGSC